MNTHKPGLAIAVATTSLTLTVIYELNPSGETNIPLPLRLMGPTLLVLAVIGDLRERRYGPLTGNRRLARHLWPMCYTVFAATGSFFLGQAR